MRGLAPGERSCLEEEHRENECAATETYACEPYTNEETLLRERLAGRGLLKKYICARCVGLGETYGLDTDDDCAHWSVTQTGHLALRLARSVL